MPTTSQVFARWPLIGRDREQAALVQALRAGTYSGALVVGPAGVGKTRLVDECTNLAEASGLIGRRLAATPAGAAIPFGVFFPLLGSTASGTPSDLARRALEEIGRLGEDGPVVVVIDDAHLLDDSSAAVVHQIATQRLAFLLLTMRSDVDVADPITGLWKDERALRLDLDPLSLDETAELVGLALGGHVDGASVHTMWEVTQGNPLYLRELVFGALDAELLEARHGVWRLHGFPHSPRLTELVESRLADLDDAERTVLEFLAFAEPLQLELADALVDRAAIDSLDRRGLLSVTHAPQRTELLFAHPVHGEVLRTTVSPLRALTVNRALADAADAIGGTDPLRLAVWRLDGGGRFEPHQMVVAARQALFANDADLAERLSRAAREADGGLEAGMLHGEALLALGRHVEAERVLGGVAAGVENDEQRALVAMNRATALYWGLSRPDEADQVLGQALTELDEQAWVDELAAMRAVNLLLAGRPLDAVATVEPLLERSEGRARVEAATVLAPALAVAGRSGDAIAVATRAYEDCLELGDQLALDDPGRHLVAKSFAELEGGLLHDATETARRAYDEAVARQSTEAQAWGALLVARAALVTGRLDIAERYAAEGAMLFRAQSQFGQVRWCLASRAWALGYRGQCAAGQDVIAELDELASDHLRMMEVDVERARAWVTVATDRAAAIERLRQAGAHGLETGTLSLAAGAFHDLVRLDHTADGLDGLVQLADRVDGRLMTARLDHARAAADRDAERLERVAASFESLGLLPVAAEASALASAAWRDRGRPRAAQRAGQQSRALARACAGLATPVLALAGESAVLTPREREVAQLAAAGRSNREIADQLVLSVRTIENHLQRAFEKLGAGRRDQLGALLGADAEGGEGSEHRRGTDGRPTIE